MNVRPVFRGLFQLMCLETRAIQRLCNPLRNLSANPPRALICKDKSAWAQGAAKGCFNARFQIHDPVPFCSMPRMDLIWPSFSMVMPSGARPFSRPQTNDNHALESSVADL